MLVARENPLPQKSIAKSLITFVAMINKIINHDLQFKKLKNIMFISFCKGMWLNPEYFADEAWVY